MYGGLLKSASAVAIIAAAGLYGASQAKAADLGGDCCADLEERVAELEATTVRKGNRKVSLQISGHVGHQVMWWDDGRQSDMYIGDGGNIFSRFRLTGNAKISPSLTAGFTYEFGINMNNIGATNQLNGGDDLGGAAAPLLRDSTVWLRHKQLGMVKIGQGSTSTDNLVLIDLGRMSSAGTPDHGLYMGGMILRGANGVLADAVGVNWQGALRGHESWDTGRRNHVLYETPALAGFTLQAAVAEDNYWDVALRYAGEFSGFRIAGGIGYQEDSEFNAGAITAAQMQAGVLCTQNCDIKSTEIKGSLSILHVPTGLFVTGSAGNRELSGSFNIASGPYVGPDVRYWHIAGGVSKNYFGLGNTVLFAEYGEHKGGLAQTSFLAGTTATVHCAGAVNCDSTVTNWGLGITQHIDAAAMELFAVYKNYSLDSVGFQAANAHLNNATADLQVIMVGTRINF